MTILKCLSMAAAAVLLMTGCNVKVEDVSKNEVGRLWPAYSASGLSGTVFGADWKALTAVARPFAQDPNRLSLEIYSEPVPSICQGGFLPTMPYATVNIPRAYAVQELTMDTARPTESNGAPLEFSTTGAIKKNLRADKTKLSIQALTDSGFEAALYAQGTDGAVVSEINGRISVVDCSKVADYSVWDELEGMYRLSSFDGQPQDGRTSVIEFDKHDQFYDKTSKQFVKALLLPLYRSVGPGTSEMFNFGPMRGLGFSKLSAQGTTKNLSYSFHGPLTYQGTDITLNLEMKVVKVDNRLDISYTLEIPGQVPAATHQLVLVK